MDTEQRTRRLGPQVARMAATLSRQYGIPQDETEQEMWVSILTHAQRYPQDKNLLVKAALDARQKLCRDNSRRRSAGKYLPRTAEIGADYDPATGGWLPIADETMDTEYQALRHTSVEEAGPARAEVCDVLGRLSGEQRTIAELLREGWRPSEIAERLGVSRPNVSYHIKKLRAAFEPYRYLIAA